MLAAMGFSPAAVRRVMADPAVSLDQNAALLAALSQPQEHPSAGRRIPAAVKRAATAAVPAVTAVVASPAEPRLPRKPTKKPQRTKRKWTRDTASDGTFLVQAATSRQCRAAAVSDATTPAAAAAAHGEGYLRPLAVVASAPAAAVVVAATAAGPPEQHRADAPAAAAAFIEHGSFGACHLQSPTVAVAAAADDTLLHHFARLEQAYKARLPPHLAEDPALSFDLDQASKPAAVARLRELFDPRW